MWRGIKRSASAEDRRGTGVRGIGALGGGFGIVAAILYMLMGGRSGFDHQSNPARQPGSGGCLFETAEEQELGEVVSMVLADPEYVWNDIFT